jgi:hypothetical protein
MMNNICYADHIDRITFQNMNLFIQLVTVIHGGRGASTRYRRFKTRCNIFILSRLRIVAATFRAGRAIIRTAIIGMRIV